MSEVGNLDRGFMLGDWEVRPTQRSLSRGDVVHQLEPRVMAVLVRLAESAGAPVTRNEFFETVWKDRDVGDEVLNTSITKLRSCLGDDRRTPTYIQTLQSVGYRLIASVTPLDTPEPAGRARRISILISAAGIVAALLVLAWLSQRSQDTVTKNELDETTVAVLPFENLSGDDAAHDGDYFSDGLADEIFGALAQQQGIRVVARTSSFAVRDAQQDIRTIGSRLGAGSVLEGTVRRNGDRLRVTASLGSANTGLQTWSQTYERRFADIFAIQHEIAQAIAGRLVGGLAASVPSPPTASLEAYQLFLRGHHAMRRRGAAPVDRAVTLFEDALALDAGFGRAYVGLAEALVLTPAYTGGDPAPYRARALAALDRARQYGAMDGRAHGVLGVIRMQERNWQPAETAFGRALALAPDDAAVHQWHSQFLASTGHLNAALTEANRAVALDPLSPTANQRLAVVAMFTGAFDDANQAFALAAEVGIEPLANLRAHVGVLLMQAKTAQAQEKLVSFQQASGQASHWVEPVVTAIASEGDPAPAAEALAEAHAAGDINPLLLAGAVFLLNDPDLFYGYTLPMALADAPLDIEMLFTDRARIYRNDPRFITLTDALGLRDYWRSAGSPETCRAPSPESWCG